MIRYLSVDPDALSRRRDLERHAGRRRRRTQAAGIPEAGRRRHDRDRRHRHAAHADESGHDRERQASNAFSRCRAAARFVPVRWLCRHLRLRRASPRPPTRFLSTATSSPSTRASRSREAVAIAGGKIHRGRHERRDPQARRPEDDDDRSARPDGDPGPRRRSPPRRRRRTRRRSLRGAQPRRRPRRDRRAREDRAAPATSSSRTATGTRRS